MTKGIPDPTPINPAAVPVEALARALGVPVATVRDHLAEGAPANPDGTVNLVHYAAWLNAPPAPPEVPEAPQHRSSASD